MEQFKGIFPALLTPFTESGDVNLTTLKKLVDWNIKKGVHGFYVTGSTAEVFLLTMEERKLVMKTVAETVQGRRTLIAHIGCIATVQAIELGTYARMLGYDAVSAVAPFYYKFSPEEIRGYYTDIVNAVALPMLIYHFPVASGVSMSVEDMSEFLEDERYMGIKHTMSDLFILERMKHVFPDKMVYNGFDEMFLAGLSMGADGGIGSTYNFMAEKFLRIYDLFSDNQLSEARKIQEDINTIVQALASVGVLQGEKEIMNLLGYDFGVCRQPFCRLSAGQRKMLEKVVLPLLGNEGESK